LKDAVLACPQGTADAFVWQYEFPFTTSRRYEKKRDEYCSMCFDKNFNLSLGIIRILLVLVIMITNMSQ
jgi:hypothetical protein